MTPEFSYSFGFKNTKNSVAFYDKTTAIFAAGKLCVLFDLNSKNQRYFQFAERAEVSAIERCGVQIAAAITGCPPSVCLFNTLSETKKFYLGPDSMKSQEFTCLSVSINIKFVAAQGGPPEWTLVIWLSQTREIFTTFSPTGFSGESVYDISFHAAGSDELVVVGHGVFKLYEYQDETEEEIGFVEHVFEKFEKSGVFYSICWPQKENLAVGTSEGEILFFRGIEIMHEMSVVDDVGNFLKDETLEKDRNDLSKAVTSIVVTAQHLVCIFADCVVLIYEGEEFSRYKLSRFVLLPPERSTINIPGELKENLDCLVNIILSPSDNDLIATTREGKLLRCCKFAEGPERRHFISLIQRQHNEPVTGIDVARSRPLIASCSQHVATLWNYRNRKQELRKKFRHEISSVAIHPTGLYMALTFDSFFRIFSILYSGLREREMVACKNCSRIGFSSGGHLFAVVSGSVIEIYSFISSTLLFEFDGHAGSVSHFDWKDHDTRLISCDIRGVVCEWDLVSSRKIWENTAVLSYFSVAVNFLTGNVIAVGSDNSVRCFDNALIKWSLEIKKELTCVVTYIDGQTFFVGTADGCLVSYSFPVSSGSASLNAHSGKLAGIKFNSAFDCLISAGSDGFIFIWETTVENDDRTEGIFSELSLVNSSSILEQKDRAKQLQLSLHHTDKTSDCNYEFNCVKHEEILQKMALNHERTVHDLNEKIILTKEEMQTILFDSVPKEDLKSCEVTVRQEVIETTFKLNETYKRSNTYATKTAEMILTCENGIDSLTKEHAKFSCSERNIIEELIKRIKILEDTLLLEKEISKQTQITSEEYKNKIQKQVYDETGNLKSSQKAALDSEKLKSTQLQLESEKLRQLTAFKSEDTKKMRNVTAGQVDYDIREKVHAVTLLKKEFRKLESVSEAKEKIVQNQEKKFGKMRKSVEDLQKSYSVTKTAIEELVEDISVMESEVESFQREITKVESSIPQLEEEILLTQDLCSTVSKKLGESVDGFQKKQKTLRETQDVISKYTSMLHQCLTRTCNPAKLASDITSLFEDSKIGFVDETEDSHLHDEFDFQIKKLKNSYDFIKGEPSKALRDKSMAEFRLSQENSKILREVHVIQKDAERLRNIIIDMEIALGMQMAQAKSIKLADELRAKIEFVIDARKRNREEKIQEISKLDMFIEEQQKEIERFQSMLSAKSKP